MDILRSSSDPEVRPLKLSARVQRKSSLPLPDVRYARLSDDKAFADASTAWIVDRPNDNVKVGTDDGRDNYGIKKAVKDTPKTNANSSTVEKCNKDNNSDNSDNKGKAVIKDAASKNKDIHGRDSRPDHLQLVDSHEFLLSLHDDHFADHDVINSDVTYDIMSSPGSDSGINDCAVSPTDTLISENEFEQFERMKQKGMVKRHYVEKANRKQCHRCKKQFNIKRRPFHCRRCGEVFCIDCVKYKRKLNKLANPDPQGKPRKVCRQCYEGDQFVFGCFRSHSADFRTERQQARYARILSQRVNSLTNNFWRDQLDMQKECKRLIMGFHTKIQMSETRSMLLEISGAIKTPDWQKSPFWELELQVSQCRKCKRQKLLRKSSGSCRVCGLALCKRCTSKDLLLYYKNEPDLHLPMLVIVNEPGCPEKEPDISLHLYVCTDCRDYIAKKQQTDITWFLDPIPTSPIEIFVAMDALLRSLGEEIENGIAKLQETMCEDGRLTDSQRKKWGLKFTDVRSQLDQYERKVCELRALSSKMETKQQHRLVQHYLRGKHQFFLEHKHLYRKLQNRMSQ